jgi:hypothetical protein
MPTYRVGITINLRLIGDVYIDADNEAEARLGIQTLIDNGVYTANCTVYVAGAASDNFAEDHIEITITQVEEVENG